MVSDRKLAKSAVRAINVAGLILIGVFGINAEDFKIDHFGAGPVSVHATLTYEGKGERLIATATNDSGVTAETAEICILSPTVTDGCLFVLWNTSPWASGVELKWDAATKRRIPDLKYQVALSKFLPPNSPVPAATLPPKAISAAPAVMGSPTLPSSPKIAKLPNLQIGTVLDSESARTFVPTGSSTQTRGTANTSGSLSGSAVGNNYDGTFNATTNLHEASETQIHSMTIRDTQLLIVTNEFLYVVNDSVEKAVGFDLHGVVGRAIANHKHGCHVIINDPVQFSQDKGYLNVVDVDGKICKMDIDKQTRIVQPKKP